MVSAPSAPAAEFVSYRAFAKLAGVSEKTIRNRVQRGLLPRLDGCLLPSTLAASQRRPRGGQPAESAEAGGPSLAEEQRLKEVALALLRRRQFQRHAAEWVERDVAAADWASDVADIRARLARVAPEVALVITCQRMGVMQEALDTAVTEALHDLCSPDARASHDVPPRCEPAVNDGTSKIDAQRVKIAAIAANHRLSLAIETGSVVNIETAATEIENCLRILRNGLLRLQATLPPRLFGRDRAAIQQTISNAIDELIADLPGPDALLKGAP